MSKRKETSTNSINREVLNEFCGVNYAIDLIEGRWKNLERWGLEHKLRMESGKNTSISVPKQVSIP